ncbi:hypothetical protein P152DRAFT_459586 [Eremomyces bilateralis CBS 781.70]|uniref:Pal1-domain-containing protein n=1 Tax=Eremomyces bilateralis CBS 781.70 TaxID=1392243 RepID=A0A6G1G037_9PEZI|nr:uncharacterized protein P152DRAFT_459586 [Eremomyces bilateralis CBS 781.70]KAF1811179.1 hypothetical protein P152DRAFT_459586 [Eremomyces bilateralis CBS 781.70]
MGGSNDWAQNYLVDPLTAPEPSAETGPGTRFRSTFQAPSESSTASLLPPSAVAALEQEFTGPDSTRRHLPSTNPSLRSQPGGGPIKNSIKPTTVNMQGGANGYLTPPTSASPRVATFEDPRTTRTSPRPNLPKNRSSSHSGIARPLPPYQHSSPPGHRTHGRGDSLGGCFPGDQSYTPLQTIRSDSKRANRSPHLKKRHQPRPDTIDKLDITSGIPYHHEGPFDATLAARNANFESSPLEAVRDSNEEALRAAPRERVIDSVRGHRPLVGVASVPPGEMDRFGRQMEYQEGENMMTEGDNAYKRWPGMKYHPDDHKGKGEPSFSEDRAAEEKRVASAEPGFDERGIPMLTRNKTTGIDGEPGQGKDTDDVGLQRSTSRRAIGDGLKRRLGSLRKKKD